MSDAFPGQINLKWYNNSIGSVNRLNILLRQPLVFDKGLYDCMTDPIWIFRGSWVWNLSEYKRIGLKRILVTGDRLRRIRKE